MSKAFWYRPAAKTKFTGVYGYPVFKWTVLVGVQTILLQKGNMVSLGAIVIGILKYVRFKIVQQKVG